MNQCVMNRQGRRRHFDISRKFAHSHIVNKVSYLNIEKIFVLFRSCPPVWPHFSLFSPYFYPIFTPFFFIPFPLILSFFFFYSLNIFPLFPLRVSGDPPPSMKVNTEGTRRELEWNMWCAGGGLRVGEQGEESEGRAHAAGGPEERLGLLDAKFFLLYSKIYFQNYHLK